MEKTPHPIYQNPNQGLHIEPLFFDVESVRPDQNGNTGIIHHDACEAITQKFIESERRAAQAEALAAKAIQRISEIEKENITDSLTGAYNRKRFTEFIENEFDPDNDRLAVVMFDVVNLKIFNDAYGHGVGDILLKSTVTSLNNLGFDKSDFLVRWGGDEFLFVYKVNDEDDQFLEKIEDQISIVKTEFENKFNKYAAENGYDYEASLSHGAAITNKDRNDNPYETVDCADNLMYAHKKKNKLEKAKEEYSTTHRLDKRPQLTAEQKKEYRKNFLFKK